MPKKHAQKSAKKGAPTDDLDTASRLGISEGVVEKVNGRPTIYTEEIAAEITSRVADGETLASICRESGMPSRTTVYGWITKDKELSERFARARESGHDAIADEALKIADNIEEDPQSRRVRVDTRLKLLAKWSPKKYGEKVELEHSGTIDSTITLTESRRAEILERRRSALTGGN